MQKAIKYSKIIAWIGIILNVILLSIVFTLYNAYFDASWLKILSTIAVIAEIIMFGGVVVKAILEYKSGVRPTRRDLIIILVVAAVVVIYYVTKFLFLK